METAAEMRGWTSWRGGRFRLLALLRLFQSVGSLRSLAAFLCAGMSLCLAPSLHGEGGGLIRSFDGRSKGAGGGRGSGGELGLGSRLRSELGKRQGDQDSMGADASQASIPASMIALQESVARRGYTVRDIRWDPVLRRTWAILEDTEHPEWPSLAVLTQLTNVEQAAERAMIDSQARKTVVSAGKTKVAGQSQGGLPARGWDGSLLAASTSGPTLGSAAVPASLLFGDGAAVAVMPSAPMVRSGDHVVLWSEQQNLRLQLNAVVEENGGVGDRVRLHLAGRSSEHWGGDPGSRPIFGVVRGPGEVEMER